MPKTIVFCADGTWNSPTSDDDKDGTPEITNVYKTFLTLKGECDSKSLLESDEQEKVLKGENGSVIQVAKYINGVGSERNIANKLFGGAGGAGTINRIVRGYTFISRNYEKGDSIILIGFSRGAYTARAIAGLIAAKGILNNISYDTQKSRESAYTKAARVFYQYQKDTKDGELLIRLVSALSYLPAFISLSSLSTSDLSPVEEIKAVGVWDTVGALGMPEMIGDGEKEDAFCFANTKLSEKVKYGFHAVSLDELRNAFTPTLWDFPQAEGQKIEQVLFAGAHADVGGGYPHTESGLSNITLAWMIDKIEACGVKFNKEKLTEHPQNHLDTAHEPWNSRLYQGKTGSRSFNKVQITGTDLSLEQRKGQQVKSAPNKAPSLYNPTNLPS